MSADVATTERFLAAVRRGCVALGLPRQRVLVGVSGGPDSVALLGALHALTADLELELRVAHVHHGLRGAEADADAAFVMQLGQQWHIPAEVLTITPAAKLVHGRKSVEEAARDARYELLSAAARQHGCPVLAVGQTANDQAETVLHHIVRGTGLAGLAGMPVARQLTESLRLVRPLLALTRADVLEFLTVRQQSFCLDATNADPKFTRNRVRGELLPWLRNQFNPQVESALLRLAEQAAEATAVLDGLAERILQTVLLEESESGCRIDAQRLSKEPDLLIRQTLRCLWIRRNWPRQEMGQKEWQRLSDLVQRPGTVALPGGLTARRTTGPLWIQQGQPERPGRQKG